MNCLIHEGGTVCLWCRADRDQHPYRWCRRCNGDLTTPDPTDREAQLAHRPTWAWRQHPCECRHGIVTMAGQPLTDHDLTILHQARTARQTPTHRYLPFNED